MMNKLLLPVVIIILCPFFNTNVFADNKIETEGIIESQVVIFQGNQFDLGEEKAFKTFVESLQNYPDLTEKLQNFFNVKLDELDTKNEERYQTLVRLLQNSQTPSQLKEYLDKAEKQNKALQTRIAELQEEAQLDPDFQEVLLKAKEILIKKDFQNYHSILQEFSDLRKKQLTRFRKELGETAFLRADEYAIRFDYINAIEQMKDAVKFLPDNTEHRIFYGELLLNLAKYDEAVEEFSRAIYNIQKSGGSQITIFNLYISLAKSWIGMGKHNEAIGCLKNAQDTILNSDDNGLGSFFSYKKLGNAWLDIGEYDKALEYFNQVWSLSLKYHWPLELRATVYTGKGEAFLKKKQYDRSLTFFQRALEFVRMDFSYSKIHHLFYLPIPDPGLSFLISGEHDKAIEYYKKNIALYKDSKLSGGDIYAYFGIGDVWYDLQKYDKSIEFYNKALSTSLSKEHPLFTLAAYSKLGDSWLLRINMIRQKNCTTKLRHQQTK